MLQEKQNYHQKSKGWLTVDPEITEGREEEWKRGHWEQKGAGGLCRTRIGQGYLFHIDVQVPPFYKTLDAFLDSL